MEKKIIKLANEVLCDVLDSKNNISNKFQVNNLITLFICVSFCLFVY